MLRGEDGRLVDDGLQDLQRPAANTTLCSVPFVGHCTFDGQMLL